MHDGAPVGGVLDDAGDADADAEEPLGVEFRGGEHLADAGADVVDDDLDVVALVLQRAFGAGEFTEGQVEQFDAHAGLADVDADHVAAQWRHAQQGTRPAAVGLDAAGLLHESVGDQVGDDVAHGSGAEPGRGTEFETAQRAVEVQPLQHGRAVGPPEVAHRAPVPPRHVAPSTTLPGLPDLQHTAHAGVRATFLTPYLM